MNGVKINYIKPNNITNKNKYFKMYLNSYGQIGTIFNNKNKLFNYYGNIIKLSNNKKTGIILYWNNPIGKKIGLLFGNNKKFQKNVVIPYSASLLKNSNKHFYVEASNAYEHLLTKYSHVQAITNKNVIKKVVGGGLNNKNIKNNGQYTRNLPYVGRHTKRLYGHPIAH